MGAQATSAARKRPPTTSSQAAATSPASPAASPTPPPPPERSADMRPMPPKGHFFIPHPHFLVPGGYADHH
ncbi:Os11g0188701 [Oryza sativa Japonica Group]|uniref:Os11g0188701 protein n=1 Tax=Oryza sativa subsp. japonica TaxID=39947 RepID=A0A0P0XZQ8_ORYSJ|nr:Os11g0188701 [Oryza sativa Japonica Group]